MKFIKINLILIILYFAITIQNIYSYFPLDYIDNNKKIVSSLSPMLEKVIPSVVNIYTKGKKNKRLYIPKEFKYFFDYNFPEKNQRYFEGLGSGVIIDSKNGYVITNYHVIKNANIIKIKLNNGIEFDANIIGKDERTDLALLKINNKKKILLTEMKLYDSDKIKVGDFVLAIGNPFGLGQTVTSGIISAVGRSGLNIVNGLENFIQTDASINKGNSGGALINIYGKLIGINTAILAPTGGNIGIGFAIPSNIVNKLSEQLIKYGKIKRGYLGIKGTELNEEISKILKINITKGAFVSEIIPNSPADKYGIKPGDIIISINNKKINNFIELKNIINITSIEQNIKLEIIRNNINKVIILKLEKISINRNKNLKYSILDGAILTDNFLKNGEILVKVKKIIKNSKADKIGIKKNDYIISINNIIIKNIDNINKIIEKKIPIIIINILRNKTKIFILVKKNNINN